MAQILQWTVVGQWLNNQSGNRGPTAEELRDTVFANARSGDIVQMHWYGTGHTALINDITDEGVTYFQSNTHPDGLAIIESHLYKWEELSEIYKANSKECGLTIYRFGNPIIEPKDLTYCPIYSAKVDKFQEININWTGQAPISWHITGELPPGMEATMITEQDSAFKISGTPEEAGTYSITLQAEDRIKLVSEPFQLEIIVRSPYTPEEESLSAGEAFHARYIKDDKFRAAIYNQCMANNPEWFRKPKSTKADSVRASDIEEEYYDVDNFVLTSAMIAQIKELNLSGQQINSLVGINYFTALEKLDCSNNALTTLNVTNCTNLTELNCSYNNLTNLYVDNCTKLETIRCSNNNITGVLDVSDCTALKTFYCSNNQLKYLSMYGCVNLEYLDCSNNNFAFLSMMNYPKLKTLYCSSNSLESLQIVNCPAITGWNYPSKLKSLYVSNCPTFRTSSLPSTQQPY